MVEARGEDQEMRDETQQLGENNNNGQLQQDAEQGAGSCSKQRDFAINEVQICLVEQEAFYL